MSKKVLLVSGMSYEGQIASGPGVISVLSGGDLATLTQRLDAIDPATISAVVSFGLAGGLNPHIKVGDVVVNGCVTVDSGQVYPCDNKLSTFLFDELKGRFQSYGGSMYGTTTPRYTAALKKQLWESSGCDSVDMESEGAAAYAAKNKLPLGVLRVISDNQTFTLPPAASVAMNTDGSINYGNLAWSLLTNPLQLITLVQMGIDGLKAYDHLWAVHDCVNWESLN